MSCIFSALGLIQIMSLHCFNNTISRQLKINMRNNVEWFSYTFQTFISRSNNTKVLQISSCPGITRLSLCTF